MKVLVIPYPALPGLHEDAEAILAYLIFAGYAHLSPVPEGAGETRITVFLVVDRWHMLIRSITYTGMRVFNPDQQVEQAVDKARTVADEIPGSQLIVANPEYRPINS